MQGELKGFQRLAIYIIMIQDTSYVADKLQTVSDIYMLTLC